MEKEKKVASDQVSNFFITLTMGYKLGRRLQVLTGSTIAARHLCASNTLNEVLVTGSAKYERKTLLKVNA